MNDKMRIAAVLLALIASLALVACGSSDGEPSDTTSPATESQDGKTETTDEGTGAEEETTIVVRDGEPVGGVEDLTYNAGDQIRFTVRSDVASEVHVHGYDLMKDVEAGGSVSFSFPAEIEGIFEVELEETTTQIAEITVNP